MKEIQEILAAYDSVGENGPAATLATVVRTTGATYRGPGARMLLIEGGQHAGLLCGGMVDKELHQRARNVQSTGAAMTFSFPECSRRAQHPATEDDPSDGLIEVLLEPLSGRADEVPIALLREVTEARELLVVATIFSAKGMDAPEAGTRLVLDAKGQVRSPLATSPLENAIIADARQVLKTGRCLNKTYAFGDEVEVFFERLSPPLRIAIFGGGLDSCPLVKLSTEVGWRSFVTDQNPAYANKGRFHLAEEVYVARPEEIRDKVPLDEYTVAVVLTHDYQQDLALIEELMPSPVPYIGLIGPKTRAQHLRKDLLARGKLSSVAQLERLFAPAGIDIGAETPHEIALAVLAEIRAHLAH